MEQVTYLHITIFIFSALVSPCSAPTLFCRNGSFALQSCHLLAFLDNAILFCIKQSRRSNHSGHVHWKWAVLIVGYTTMEIFLSVEKADLQNLHLFTFIYKKWRKNKPIIRAGKLRQRSSVLSSGLFQWKKESITKEVHNHLVENLTGNLW